MEILIKCSLMPNASQVSSGTARCEVVIGCETEDSTPAKVGTIFIHPSERKKLIHQLVVSVRS